MLARTHLVFGVAAVSVASCFGVVPANPVTIIAALFGSLLPDVDHPKSSFGRKILPISWAISRVFGHRGITHSVFAVAALNYALIFKGGALPPWCAAIMLGYLSHLISDWLTPMGIPFLWPYRKKFSSPLVVRTGGAGEILLMMAVVIVIVAIFVLKK